MVEFYKPKTSGNGSSCTFSFNLRDKCMYTSLMKQHSWDSQAKRANFKGNKDNPKAKANVKYNTAEIGGFINAIESNEEYKGYHSSQNQIIRFSFGPYIVDGVQKGFTYRLQREAKDDSTDKVNFLIGFYPNELRLIKEYLMYVLHKVFDASLSAQNRENLNSNNANNLNEKSENSFEESYSDDDDIW